MIARLWLQDNSRSSGASAGWPRYVSKNCIIRQRFRAEKPLAFGWRRRMYSARTSTVPWPQPSAAILRLMCSPIFQYRSISSLLTAATARPRAASIRRSTSSKSAGADKAAVRGTFGFFFGVLLMTASPGNAAAYHCSPPGSNRTLPTGRDDRAMSGFSGSGAGWDRRLGGPIGDGPDDRFRLHRRAPCAAVGAAAGSGRRWPARLGRLAVAHAAEGRWLSRDA